VIGTDNGAQATITDNVSHSYTSECGILGAVSHGNAVFYWFVSGASSITQVIGTPGAGANSAKSASIKFVQVASAQIASSASVSVVYAKAQTAGI